MWNSSSELSGNITAWYLSDRPGKGLAAMLPDVNPPCLAIRKAVKKWIAPGVTSLAELETGPRIQEVCELKGASR